MSSDRHPIVAALVSELPLKILSLLIALTLDPFVGLIQRGRTPRWLAAVFDGVSVGSFEFDLEVLPFHLELRDGILLHQVYDGFDIF